MACFHNLKKKKNNEMQRKRNALMKVYCTVSPSPPQRNVLHDAYKTLLLLNIKQIGFNPNFEYPPHNDINISNIGTIDKDFKVDQSNLYDPLI